ncbi:hypothetical protein P378_08545 [Desulforamulus profundi]|jgi:fatty acid desaturase|uniref:Uncharacterized protein n=2 Tax=Desulforamulus TaxID=2916693 RepID=A0A2C6MGG2_9FIRM|nr:MULTISPECIES: hypothetical protein [Desulforamulus]PHJ38543.1 hypothetical protein P378_08545 [Desulforamulus profundi]SHF46005.1 hypothetical protein SAMN02745133_02705 [Desulforamulus putei DSM 12395]
MLLVGLLFVLKLIVFALCAGVVISFIVFVPLTIYVAPYCLWVGHQHTLGRHKDKMKEGVFKTAKHATILYKSWILRKEPTF